MYSMLQTPRQQVMFSCSTGDHVAATITIKLRVVEYAKHYSVREAACKFNVSVDSISGRNGWEAKEEELRCLNFNSKIAPSLNHVCRYHVVEGRLRT